VTKVPAVGPVAVTFRTTPVTLLVGTPPMPRTRRLMVPP
jgi:hypothetical protein